MFWPPGVERPVGGIVMKRSTDGGLTWSELPALRNEQGSKWCPGAGGMGLHTILLDRSNEAEKYSDLKIFLEHGLDPLIDAEHAIARPSRPRHAALPDSC